ncbi:hypothetical protein N657DRAFT_682593 [Parathielavia appendiculata]|uniref:LYR motif-containing protein Cup1-like N-terminal domain-containing protein n=1 Tax=Parathielavia appendiculata TaxID=2587402 RepID=A0AAN6Z0Y7_9PEZI|nr:hypothetical protein N657DRAFT_682593 [Parathielavia appendiculata]
MSRPFRLAKPQNPLHLYRHLLREASYLPPVARPFIEKRIQSRFQKSRKDDEERSAKHIAQAHHDLRLLRAANLGDTARMRRVLLHAFGRLGRRRRELMDRVIHRDVPTETEELQKYAAEASALVTQGSKLDWLDMWDVDKLRTYARSQMQAGLINSPKPTITAFQITPDKVIPTENAWGRPLAPKLYRTKLKNVWKAVADKCMPPLPKEQWEQLRAIATGQAEGNWLPPPRRPVARSLYPDEQTAEWDWQSYAIKPVAVVDRPANRRNKLLSGAVDDNTPTGDPEPLNCHKYTARMWRRLLGGIWQLTATMEKKPGGRGWHITWGKEEFRPAPASAGAMEFFTDFPEPAQPKGGGKAKT